MPHLSNTYSNLIQFNTTQQSTVQQSKIHNSTIQLSTKQQNTIRQFVIQIFFIQLVDIFIKILSLHSSHFSNVLGQKSCMHGLLLHNGGSYPMTSEEKTKLSSIMSPQDYHNTCIHASTETSYMTTLQLYYYATLLLLLREGLNNC